jgi:tRNA (mo5U34)-methyltransferase
MFQLPEFYRFQVNNPYRELYRLAAEETGWAWLRPLLDQSNQVISGTRHGDLPRWREVLKSLPRAKHFFDGKNAAPRLGYPAGNTGALAAQLTKLHPWRKGPLSVAGVDIDTEWRSDWKWDRIAEHLDLAGHRVLDIGCGNGYYGWRMLGQGADSVIGIDPTLIYVMQWQACRHFAGPVPNYVLPLGIEDLTADAGGFDSLFSMGVLYHRRDPVAHLGRLGSLLSPGGQLVLETLVLDGDEDHSLVPGRRYARMRNVWAVPTIARLRKWMSQAGLGSVRVLDVTRTSTQEQRTTAWMRFESLRDSLDPENNELTVEGYPAPVRAALLATH